jgi:mannose-1-phosphate guanylyltransferase/mannose-6-phosphate isomerase
MDGAEAKGETRPWGAFDVLLEGQGYKVKRLSVNPGKRLSMHYHLHREEHWVIVRGTARILIAERGEEGRTGELTIPTGETIFIPKEYIHRLENPGDDVLEIIEVQMGDCLSEDDIVRLSDDFGRVG